MPVEAMRLFVPEMGKNWKLDVAFMLRGGGEIWIRFSLSKDEPGRNCVRSPSKGRDETLHPAQDESLEPKPGHQNINVASDSQGVRVL